MSEEEEARQSQFAEWLKQQLHQRAWKQGKLIAESGGTKEERLSSAAVSRYTTGKMLPDAASCQKIARALEVPVELVLQKAGLIDTPSSESDWLQRVIHDLAYAVEAGQLAEETRLLITSYLHREQEFKAVKVALAEMREKERQYGWREEAQHYSAP